MNRTFTHSFEDTGNSSMSFSDPKDPTSITMKVAQDGQFWLVATPEGCLHLARVFAELGLRSFEYGFTCTRTSTSLQITRREDSALRLSPVNPQQIARNHAPAERPHQADTRTCERES